MKIKNTLELPNRNSNFDNIPLTFTSSLKSSGIHPISSEGKIP